MKAPPNVLNTEQSAAFDAAIAKWQLLLGLSDWRIERGRKSAKTRNMAEISISHAARLAVYRTGDFGSAEITPLSIESTALHEVLHVFLAEVKNHIEYGITDVDAIDSAEHRVVNLLEKLLLSREPT